ncbi:class I SAM-dependent methyltransferase [Colwellia psychrerythraea]|uniref:S-adenosyl-L-methionine-dependent methyltransferase n=1 Tax=Colwellia psychrerythraea TaxID=28229 RepID=A0A099KTY3_COLPS|nr:SAM-dependent methyltransferase [Colwellia psychrerythraea]KGJ94016.1 methyltransferase [Colwellia psychrerythraea]
MNKFSKTSSAESMALIRTLGYKENGITMRTEDYMAEVFLSKFMAFILSFSFFRSLILAIYSIKLPGGMPYIMAKSRAIDDMLLRALDGDEKPEQLIILGAGYDTRAYRFHHQLAHIQCFEIDHPEMIARKRAAMKNLATEKGTASTQHENDVSSLNSVHYCGADFNGKDHFDLDWLVSQGIDKNKKTLFIIDGVSYFLQEDAFKNLLSVISLFPETSQVIFDYAYADIFTGGIYRGSEAFKSSLKKMGEPATYGIHQEDLMNTMQELGFDLTDLMTPEQIEQQYLTKPNGESVQPYGFLNIAFLRKGAKTCISG